MSRLGRIHRFLYQHGVDTKELDVYSQNNRNIQ